jgi:2-polyprenyl-6-methoxyphenol hydroxylase-like FAD-dependent oxidoreductase
MGHPHSVSHKQPALEKSIRDVAARYESCELRSGCTVDGISEDEEWVYVTYIDRNQEQKKVRARYLVGADGKTGFTRKKYLEKKGVVMEVQNKYIIVYIKSRQTALIPTGFHTKRRG